jgi:hypothetical protein
MSMKNSNDIIGNQSLDLPVCSAMPQPLCHRVLPRKAQYTNELSIKMSENPSVVLKYGLTKSCVVYISKNGTQLSRNLARPRKYCDNQTVFE